MSAVGEHFWQYGIRCDHDGCTVSIWRLGVSEQAAFTSVQVEARAAGWSVVPDRLYPGRDLCPDHRRCDSVCFATGERCVLQVGHSGLHRAEASIPGTCTTVWNQAKR